MKLRSVNTKFWDDSFITELKPNEKLLFLYLLTNPLTTSLGIYEISVKRIGFDTGLTVESIQKALESFQTAKKVFYHKNMVILPNFLKNQSMNFNMQRGVVNAYNDLPTDLKPEGFTDKIESFESVLKALESFDNLTKHNLIKPNLKESISEERTHLFCNSIYFDIEKLKPNFSTPDLSDINIEFYHQAANDWSDAKNVKRTDRGWLATIRTFIRKDNDENKLKTYSNNGNKKLTNSEAIRNWSIND